MNLRTKYNKQLQFYTGQFNFSFVKYIGLNKSILDVGCSNGEQGKFIKKHKNAKVTGIDISSIGIKAAKKVLDKALVINIEEDKLPFKNKSFDIILCADILEHLHDPLSALKKLSPLLKDDGIFILSIPNIANIKIRWNLLWGRFDYEDSGIMDNTHIRFFTKKNVEKLVTDAGLKIKEMDYTVGFTFLFLRKEYIKNSKLLQALKYRLTKLMPSLTCNQFIVIASKINTNSK